MKNKILGWIGIVWGTLVLLRGLTRLVSGDVGGNAYGAGQLAGFAFGALLVYAGWSALKKAKAGDGSAGQGKQG